MTAGNIRKSIAAAFTTMNNAHRTAKLAEHAQLVLTGVLPCASTLPHIVSLDLNDVFVIDNEPSLSRSIVERLDRTVEGKGELGFTPDGNAHIGFEDAVDADMFRLSL